MTLSGTHVDAVLARLQSTYGPAANFGRSKRLFQFGSRFTCSINFSKELRGQKFFYGLATEVLDQNSQIPATDYGHFVLLICGQGEAVLWLPRKLVLGVMNQVATGKLDVLQEAQRFILQTTGHPKLDVTQYLNAEPAIEIRTSTDAPETPKKVRSHSEIQLGLAKIGTAEGCRVWVPASDRNLQFGSESLRELTCDRLPNFGFDENTRRIVSNLDVLWLDGSVIRRAFEIEATTSIYSGLLRLNDLVLAQPNNRIDLCIAAEWTRQNRVVGQIRRPTFRSLANVCSFISFDQLRTGVSEVDHLKKRGVTRVQGILSVEPLHIPDEFLDPIDLQI